MDRLFLSAAYSRSSAFWRNRGSLGGTLPSRFLTEIPEELIEPVDVASKMALRGDASIPGQVPDSVREVVKAEYSELNGDWTVLPGAYKFAEQQGELATVRANRRQTRLDEAPKEPSGYAVGQTVRHPKFGEGKITKIQPAGGGDYFLQINFTSEGAKLLSEAKAPLTLVEDED
jgi:hypothetical protein